MNQSLLAPFGTAIERVEAGLAALRQGQGVLVVDDEDRENEGDLIFAAESLTMRKWPCSFANAAVSCVCVYRTKRSKPLSYHLWSKTTRANMAQRLP